MAIHRVPTKINSSCDKCANLRKKSSRSSKWSPIQQWLKIIKASNQCISRPNGKQGSARLWIKYRTVSTWHRMRPTKLSNHKSCNQLAAPCARKTSERVDSPSTKTTRTAHLTFRIRMKKVISRNRQACSQLDRCLSIHRSIVTRETLHSTLIACRIMISRRPSWKQIRKETSSCPS